MRELEKHFSNLLQQKIKEKVWASVYVIVEYDGTLYIHIQERNTGIDYGYQFRDFATRVYHGFDTDKAAEIVLKDYHNFIMTKFFR